MSSARHHPRVTLTLPATLRLADGFTFSTHTENVSCAGFQVRAPAEAVSALFPASYQPAARDRAQAHVSLQADTPGQSPTVLEARCEAVVGRRLAESVFYVGFQFLDLGDAELAWLQARIATALRRGAVQ